MQLPRRLHPPSSLPMTASSSRPHPRPALHGSGCWRRRPAAAGGHHRLLSPPAAYITSRRQSWLACGAAGACWHGRSWLGRPDLCGPRRFGRHFPSPLGSLPCPALLSLPYPLRSRAPYYADPDTNGFKGRGGGGGKKKRKKAAAAGFVDVYGQGVRGGRPSPALTRLPRKVACTCRPGCLAACLAHVCSWTPPVALVHLPCRSLDLGLPSSSSTCLPAAQHTCG